MIVEERVYTVKPGAIAEYVRVYGDEGQQIQMPVLGKMVGWFWTELGPLNQTVQMWAFESFAERQAKRAALMNNAAWRTLAFEKILPLILTQENRLLNPAPWSPASPAAGPTGASIVEQRNYTLKPGGVAEYMKHYEAEGFKIQGPTLGRMAGWFHTEIGPLNQIVHMWGYDSFAERERRRGEIAKNPAWRAFVGKVQPLILRQENKILIPAPWSPTK